MFMVSRSFCMYIHIHVQCSCTMFICIGLCCALMLMCTPQGIVGLCCLFESLLHTRQPDLVLHLTAIQADP